MGLHRTHEVKITSGRPARDTITQPSLLPHGPQIPHLPLETPQIPC
jgi:hypothetical protein